MSLIDLAKTYLGLKAQKADISEQLTRAEHALMAKLDEIGEKAINLPDGTTIKLMPERPVYPSTYGSPLKIRKRKQ